MLLLLLFLSSVILVYGYLTDSNRVRAMAGAYLSELLGGEVHIGKANLSIFEGLRLDDVTLKVDSGNEADVTLFHAQTFLIRYNPTELLAGRLQATQITAIDPKVTLVEDPLTHRWNYQRLRENSGVRRQKPSKEPQQPMVLPEIILRDAQVAYMEISDGKVRPVGWYSLEGNLTRGENPDLYNFNMQSRGSASMGPSVTGTIDPHHGVYQATMMNFTFGPDIKTMLFAEVRAWCETHELQGRIDVPTMSYSSPKNYSAEIQLSNVDLAVQPQEWMSRVQTQRMNWLHEMLTKAESRGWISVSAGESLRAMSTPEPIHLRDVSGTFVFTNQGIVLDNLVGRLENNWFGIDGSIGGYSPDAPASIKISSRHLELPPFSPNYVGSLPPEVQEVYERFQPQGLCSFSIQLDRKEAGGRPLVSGTVSVENGQFCFSDFPYPLHRASGTIVIGPDRLAHMDGIRLLNISGYGMPDGPNANSTVTLDGFIGPLDQVAGVWVDVRGHNVFSEPAVRKALPWPVDRALRIFDPRQTGQFPKFRTDFICHIVRQIGPHMPWQVDTDINLYDTEGTLASFPYPMKAMTGRLEVREGYVDIIGATAHPGNGTLTIDGRVTWKTKRGDPTPLGPDLKVTARNIPIDDNLLAALPPAQRSWLEGTGATGMLDIDGHVFPAQKSAAVPSGSAIASVADIPPALPAGSGIGAGSFSSGSSSAPAADRDIDYLFDINVHDGGIWPVDGTFALSGLSGKMRLTPQGVEMTSLSARRGDAKVTGHGSVTWNGPDANLTVSGKAENLTLDNALYKLLPAAARDGWDAVQPVGTVDAALDFKKSLSVSIVDDTAAKSLISKAAAANGLLNLSPVDNSLGSFKLQITPRELSITPRPLPYKLDHLTGGVTICPDKIVLTAITAHHGDAAIAFTGQGDLGDAQSWDLKISAQNMAVDDDLLKAAPDAVSSILKTLNVHGKMSLEFSKLAYRDSMPGKKSTGIVTGALGNRAPDGKSTTAVIPPATPDIDFACKITLADDSMDLGFPAEHVNSTIDLAGLVRKGSLYRLAGKINADSLTIAGRDASNFKGDIVKSTDDSMIQISHLEGSLAGGDIAGDMEFNYSDAGPSKYDLRLVLRDADVQALTHPSDKTIQGRVTASLQLGGVTNDPSTRRGHGDVRVYNADMYNIPVVLGLLQVTNLALPITSPFSEATTRYTMEGQRVTFESIDLRSKDMTMTGSGQMDFGTGKVSMSFATDNAALVALPVVGPLMQTMKHELFKIHVDGSIKAPKVSASTFDVVTTTIDQVFNGEEKK